jgi:acetyltransferase
VPHGGLARSIAEAQSIAKHIGRPVALKACSPDLLHKTEAGVIRLGLRNPQEVESAFEEILRQAKTSNPTARLDGILVEEMIGGETREVIVGARQDMRFGPIVTFGLGGIFVEAIKDFAVWPAPLTIEDARRMITSIRGYRILTAFRSRPPADVEALVRVLCEIGQLANQWQERIAELEINPLFVLPEGRGAIVGDALVALR